MVVTKAAVSRELAKYLGVEIDDSMADGAIDWDRHVAVPNYGGGPGERDPEDAERSAARANAALRIEDRYGEITPEGTAVRAIAEELEPRYTCPGESMPDGRCGSQGALESLVTHWPALPSWTADWREALGGLHYLQQGEDWDRLLVDGRSVWDAIVAGRTAHDVRRAVQAGDEEFGVREKAEK